MIVLAADRRSKAPRRTALEPPAGSRTESPASARSASASPSASAAPNSPGDRRDHRRLEQPADHRGRCVERSQARLASGAMAPDARRASGTFCNTPAAVVRGRPRRRWSRRSPGELAAAKARRSCASPKGMPRCSGRSRGSPFSILRSGPVRFSSVPWNACRRPAPVRRAKSRPGAGSAPAESLRRGPERRRGTAHRASALARGDRGRRHRTAGRGPSTSQPRPPDPPGRQPLRSGRLRPFRSRSRSPRARRSWPCCGEAGRQRTGREKRRAPPRPRARGGWVAGGRSPEPTWRCGRPSPSVCGIARGADLSVRGEASTRRARSGWRSFVASSARSGRCGGRWLAKARCPGSTTGVQFADVFAAGGFDLVMCGLASNMPGKADPPIWSIAGSGFVSPYFRGC